MDPFHIASDAALWSCGDDQTAVWSETPGFAQPEPMFGFDLGLDGQFTDTTWNSAPSFENPASGSATIANPEVNSTMGFSPAFTYPDAQPGNFNQMIYPDLFSPWPTPMPTPSSTDGDSISSSQSTDVASWAGVPSPGMVADPYGLSMPSSSATLTVPSLPGFSGFEVPSQFNVATTSYFPGNGSVMGLYVPYSDSLGAFCTAVGHNRDAAELNLASLGVADIGGSQPTSHTTYKPVPSSTALRKRPRGAGGTSGNRVAGVDGGQGRNRRKKVKGTRVINGVLGAAGHRSRARRKPSTKAPVTNNGKSEAAGRGAERLAAQNAQELYHRILLGPSSQESMESTTSENLPWVEGREQDVTWQHGSSMVEVVQPQEVSSSATEVEQEDEDAEGGTFPIPKRLSQRHSGLLNATAEDWARACVRILKCKLCPDAGFCNWEGFKRHCDQSEAHPFRLSFCELCGDFFARIDSLKRHHESPPPECLCVPPEVALAKRRATERAHRDFLERLERCLETGEDIGDPFSKIIMDMFPDSSKRGSRQQNRLES